MPNRRALITCLCVTLFAGLLAGGAPPEGAGSPGAQGSPGARGSETDFARGRWDASAWMPVSQPNQDKPRTFTQRDDALVVTLESFAPDDYKRESDNAILVTDTGLDEAQVEVTFRAGPGFNKGSTPGIVISPGVVDGVMDKAIGVFVAPYGMVAWSYAPGDQTKPVRYKFIGQLNKTLDPAKPHVIKCRYSKARKAVALQVDDSDVLVIKFIGHPTLGTVDLELNSKVGIWGCHGTCEFYKMKVIAKGTLPFDWPEKESR